MNSTLQYQAPAHQRYRKPLAISLFTTTLLVVVMALLLHSGQRLLVLAVSTFISEDLTCIAAGQLIQHGDIDAVSGILGCFLGIFVGDFGLWLLGRMAKPALNGRLEAAKQFLLDRGSGMTTVFFARFIPGMRLPVYVAMGAAGVGPVRFAIWTFLVAAVWTPLIVLLVAHAGAMIVHPLQVYFGVGWLSLIVAIGVGFVTVRIGTMLLTEIGRYKLLARIARIWRWEFWPSWLFYLPVVPWIAWLSLRHRGFTTITAANPGIPHGGFVGESKFAILRALDPQYTGSARLITSGALDERVARVDQIIAKTGWSFPIILKPDAGQRGAGVRLIRDRAQAIEYLEAVNQDVVAQRYHPGPFEAGIFYYRIPGESRGHILSITDKHFSQLTGDGKSTLEQLIWRHPRYRMQAGVFLERHANDASRALARGEVFPLAIAGNHCQGTMFRDGSELLTPELETRIDELARGLDGFFFGRFDVRYSNVERFKAGEDLTIIELNGVTSESTNLYDPSWSLLRAYRLLFKQWSILFRIGAANRAAGFAHTSTRSLARATLSFYRTRSVALTAD